MKKIMKIMVIVILAVVVVGLLLLHIVLPTLLRNHSRIPRTPLSDTGSVWICEEPYMWFEVRDVDLGTFGIGELEIDDGDRIPVRFMLERGSYCIILESAYREDSEGDEFRVVLPEDGCIMSGIYKMNRKGTKVTLSISEDDIYDYQYDTLTLYRQDPAGTEETAAQP